MADSSDDDAYTPREDDGSVGGESAPITIQTGQADHWLTPTRALSRVSTISPGPRRFMLERAKSCKNGSRSFGGGGNPHCRVYGKEPTDTLRSYLVQDLYNSFYRMLSERRGRIKKTRTIQTHWNALTLVRQLETGCVDVEPAVRIEICGMRPSPSRRRWPDGVMPWLTGSQARQNWIAEVNLSTAKEEKPIMRPEDEFELLKTLWESPEMRLQHERLRVQLALMIQLARITGTGALRRLQFKDRKIALLPNHAGGDRPRLVMDFTCEHTKG
ncbi:hypothetical protein LTR12_014803 [Friedmanniomyces endolithicus]|nr:hypothetical protein LTR12_014803 [Friedmanniomyces endolithicus]